MFKHGNMQLGRTPPRAAAVLVLLLLAAADAKALAAEGDPPLITVTGQAEIKVAPDEVVFSLEVKKADKDLAAAKAQNDESVRAILALARRFNVAAQDVKTDYITVAMKYTTDLIEGDDSPAARRVKREFLGYEVEKTVIVRFTDIPRFEDFFSEVLKAGVSSVNRVEFRTSQLRRHKDQARAAAIRAAQEKAAALAKEINQTIGKAVVIREGNFQDSRASANYTGYVGGSFSEQEYSTIAPGMITVTAQVTVSFILN